MLRDGKEPLLLDFDRVAARLKILPLLLLRTAVHAELRLGEGTIEADLMKKGEVVSADIDIDDLDFTSPPMLPKLIGMPLLGKLNASGSIYLAEQPAQSTGTLTFELKNGAFGPGPVAGFTMPQIGVGNHQKAVSFDLKDGKAKVTSFENGGGNFSISPSLARWRC